MSSKHRWASLSTVVAGAAILLSAGFAAASTHGRTVAALPLTTRQPAASTGLGLSIHYRDEHDPNAKPKTFSKLVIQLPAGLRIDQGLVPACTASDAELMAQGASACDSQSRVGSGVVTLMTGLPGGASVLTADVTIMQGQGEWLDLFRARGSDQTLAVDHVKIAGDTLIDRPQAVPGGAPDGRSAVRDVNLHVNGRTAYGRRAYLTTPPSCPAARVWRASFTVSYDDGVTDVARSRTPCSPAPSPPPGAKRPCSGDRDRLASGRCAPGDSDRDD